MTDPLTARRLAPGTIHQVDHRPRQSCPPEGSEGTRALKVVQWNIERGYCIEEIKALLAEQDADLICLQELDIGCERSRYRDCVQEIAAALRMKCAFLVEFEELHSPLRSARDQGGGVHGNAILSRYNFKPYVVTHGHHPVDWAADGEQLSEPRRGQRAVLAADVMVPGLGRAVVCYCLHLEVFCGILGRLRQFSDVLADSHRRRSEGHHYQIIMGDLNTMAHGIARFSPKYCRDFLRFWSLGHSEASFWSKYLLDVLHNGSDDSPNHKLLPLHPRHFSNKEICALRNSHFFDPFDIACDMTLSNYKGLYQGKLDWCLLRGFSVLSTEMGNMSYTASDHRLLSVISVPEGAAVAESLGSVDPGKTAYNLHHHICRGSDLADKNVKALNLDGQTVRYAYRSCIGAVNIFIFSGVLARIILVGWA